MDQHLTVLQERDETGQATAQTIGNLTQITNTPGAILNWQQFNIDVGQTTQFIQQNAASQVFNRVTGGDVSQILGTLQSNGQVFLINPAGVFFGQGAVVDTAGFLASTLAASNTDLLNGHLKFSDSSGGVLPGVTVTAKNAQTGLTQQTTSGGEGDWQGGRLSLSAGVAGAVLIRILACFGCRNRV